MEKSEPPIMEIVLFKYLYTSSGIPGIVAEGKIILRARGLLSDLKKGQNNIVLPTKPERATPSGFQLLWGDEPPALVT